MDQHLVEALDAIDRPGDVAAAGDRELTMPGLEVEGLGAIGLPLPKAQARALIRRCRQAPYGKGTQTLVDTDVRRVWEMDPAQFELTNPKWKALIRSIIKEVKQRLGLEECKLSAHLYKLLLYEKGSFFLPHRDGERLDAMVATLIVTLPCAHEGGELVVRHEGREHEIAFPGAASGVDLSWAAFYADCSHEVRPLRSGYRPCLVYNVTLARSRRRKERIDAPSYGAVTARMAELLGAWPETDETQKRAVTLEHAYTQDGLELDGSRARIGRAPRCCSRRRSRPAASRTSPCSPCGNSATSTMTTPTTPTGAAGGTAPGTAPGTATTRTTIRTAGTRWERSSKAV